MLVINLTKEMIYSMKKMIIGLTIGMLIGSSTVTLAATSNTVKATLVKYRIMISGKNQTVSTNQLLYNGNTYIQLREAGNLFGYYATFDGPNKTIHFNSKDSNQNKWISLLDFSIATNLQVEPDQEKPDVYKILKGNDVILNINALDLKENEERAVAAQNGTMVYFTKIKGSVVLNRANLKPAGLM